VEKFISTDDTFPRLWRIQTALCTMTISMEAPRSGQAAF